MHDTPWGPAGEVSDLLHWALAAVGRSWALPGSGGRASEGNVVWDASTADGILLGADRDSIAVGQILRHGTAGFGLDESLRPLVFLDRHCYRFAADGAASEAPPAARAVFAAVTTFSPDVVVPVAARTGPAALDRLIDAALPRGAFMVSVRIDASFSWVRVGETDLRGEVGTLVGVRTPEDVGGGATPGIRFAFVDERRVQGGFVVDFLVEDADVELSFSTETRLAAPRLGVVPGPRGR
jgi:alpha-acetolactate decarboxylase